MNVTPGRPWMARQLSMRASRSFSPLAISYVRAQYGVRGGMVSTRLASRMRVRDGLRCAVHRVCAYVMDCERGGGIDPGNYATPWAA